MKQTIIALIALLLIGGGIYFFNQSLETYTAETDDDVENNIPTEPNNGIGDGAEPLDEVLQMVEGPEVIGSTVDGNDIIAHHYGTGETEIILVGGLHGGYSWNTSLLMYEVMDYFETNPQVITDNLRVTVIPAVNVDGLAAVTGTTGEFDANAVTANETARIAARFNSNDVDLNRNFNCEWEATGTWQSRSVSGGDAPFSEPETKAIRDYVESHNPDAVVAYYSAAGGVYSSNCRAGVLPETNSLTNLYASASGYSAHEEFDYYEITGDMVNWLAAKNIPAISVLLTDHQNTELSKNLRGIEALLANY